MTELYDSRFLVIATEVSSGLTLHNIQMFVWFLQQNEIDPDKLWSGFSLLPTILDTILNTHQRKDDLRKALCSS